MTSNNETVSRHNRRAGNIANLRRQRVTLSALPPANVDRRETLRFSGNKINCFSLVQSSSVYYGRCQESPRVLEMCK